MAGEALKVIADAVEEQAKANDEAAEMNARNGNTPNAEWFRGKASGLRAGLAIFKLSLSIPEEE